MSVCATVGPRSSPASVIDEYGVSAPIKAPIETRTPSPGSEECSKRYSKAEADAAPNRETRPRREENDPRVICRHHHERRIRRHDRDVRSTAHHNLAVGPQDISEIPGLCAFPLDGVHHVLLLREKRVPQVRSPVDVGSHHVQHGREWQKRLHAGIPRDLVGLNRIRQRGWPVR